MLHRVLTLLPMCGHEAALRKDYHYLDKLLEVPEPARVNLAQKGIPEISNMPGSRVASG
jgi:hypothetical protein